MFISYLVSLLKTLQPTHIIIQLGWGDERFIDKPDNDNEKEYNSVIPLVVANKNSTTCWINNKILIIDEATEDAHATTDAIAKATYLIPLIER